MTAHQTPDVEEDTRGVSRRLFITASAAAGLALSQSPARAAIVRTDLASLPPYGNGTLPAGSPGRAVANSMLIRGDRRWGRFVGLRGQLALLLHRYPERAC